MLIAASLLADLCARAAEAPDREICGLLFGDGARITAAEATRNVSPACRDTFEIDPQALFAALRAERSGGRRVLGHYHSHPSGSPLPSARDAAAAEPGRLWLILGGGEARLWLATAEGFRPVPIETD